MIYQINKTKVEVSQILYVRENGNDNNDGMSKQKALKTINKAVSLVKSNLTVIDIGMGDFEVTSYISSGGHLSDAWKPIIFYGKNKNTRIILNQLSERPTYEHRNYWIHLGNANSILTNCIVEINSTKTSGEAWGPNVWNSLFPFCRGTMSNCIFNINSIALIGYSYFNDVASGIPRIQSCVFCGNYTIEGNYSSTPYYNNCLFLRFPRNYVSYTKNRVLTFAENNQLISQDYSFLKNTSPYGVYFGGYGFGSVEEIGFHLVNSLPKYPEYGHFYFLKLNQNDVRMFIGGKESKDYFKISDYKLSSVISTFSKLSIDDDKIYFDGKELSKNKLLESKSDYLEIVTDLEKININLNEKFMSNIKPRLRWNEF